MPTSPARALCLPAVTHDADRRQELERETHSLTNRVASVRIAGYSGVELRLLRVPVNVEHDVCQRQRVVRVTLEDLAYELRLQPTSKGVSGGVREVRGCEKGGSAQKPAKMLPSATTTRRMLMQVPAMGCRRYWYSLVGLCGSHDPRQRGLQPRAGGNKRMRSAHISSPLSDTHTNLQRGQSVTTRWRTRRALATPYPRRGRRSGLTPCHRAAPSQTARAAPGALHPRSRACSFPAYRSSPWHGMTWARGAEEVCLCDHPSTRPLLTRRGWHRQRRLRATRPSARLPP